MNQSKKKLLTTGQALADLIYECGDRLFDHFFVYIQKREWDKYFNDLTIDNSRRAKILRKHWFDWTVLPEDKNLVTLDQENPDTIYFCGTRLGELTEANTIVGEDMIFSPQELVINFFTQQKRS